LNGIIEKKTVPEKDRINSMLKAQGREEKEELVEKNIKLATDIKIIQL
jgi:hypothetical protein